MKQFHKIACFLVFLTLLSACTTTQTPVDNQTTQTVSEQIAPQKGRINIETSLARSLKYNITPLKQQISPKFLGEEARQEAFINLRKLREGQVPGLSVSLKELDFAILYASLNKTSDSALIDSILTQTTAQNLALGTIKAHKSALYSHKQIFEINRKIRQYQKQIATLMKNKNLNEEELEKKKALEENIDKLNQILNRLQQNLEDFRQLTKLDNIKFEIESRSFFENIALQPQTKADDYQSSAFANRLELINTTKIPLEQITRQFDKQLDTEQTGVQGYFVQDTAYQQNLAALGDAQASVLLQTALDYQKASLSKKEKIQPKLEEELYKAIYLQIEIAYQLAQKTTSDNEIQQENLQQIKKNIRALEKISRPKPEQQIELWKEQIKLFENETLVDQILAEKAMTITSLRFYGGQLIVSPETITKTLPELTSFWDQALSAKFIVETKDNILQKSEATLPEKPNSWAHQDNWLEELMAEKQSASTTPKLMSRTLTNLAEDYNTKKIMQLGAFLDTQTAEKEWQKITSDFPELKNKTPIYEKTEVTGIALYRLLLKSASGGFKDICIRLRRKGYECFLRD